MHSIASFIHPLIKRHTILSCFFIFDDEVISCDNPHTRIIGTESNQKPHFLVISLFVMNNWGTTVLWRWILLEKRYTALLIYKSERVNFTASFNCSKHSTYSWKKRKKPKILTASSPYWKVNGFSFHLYRIEMMNPRQNALNETTEIFLQLTSNLHRSLRCQIKQRTEEPMRVHGRLLCQCLRSKIQEIRYILLAYKRFFLFVKRLETCSR